MLFFLMMVVFRAPVFGAEGPGCVLLAGVFREEARVGPDIPFVVKVVAALAGVFGNLVALTFCAFCAEERISA